MFGIVQDSFHPGDQSAYRSAFAFFMTSLQGRVIKGSGLGSSEKRVCVEKLQDSERLATTAESQGRPI